MDMKHRIKRTMPNQSHLIKAKETKGEKKISVFLKQLKKLQAMTKVEEYRKPVAEGTKKAL